MKLNISGLVKSFSKQLFIWKLLSKSQLGFKLYLGYKLGFVES